MGVEADEYTTFKSLNQWVIKPAIKEINDLTNYFVEAESKRLGRKISELKFVLRKSSSCLFKSRCSRILRTLHCRCRTQGGDLGKWH